MIALILTVAALVLFVLAGLNLSHARVQLGWLGLACLTVALLAGKV